MKLIVVAHFEANRKYIAQNLCENKSKPELKCRGKCYLKKQLAKEEKNELANDILKIKSEILFITTIVSPVFDCFYAVEKPIYFYESSEMTAHFQEKLQPPEIKFPA